MKLLIVGAGGMLGSDLVAEAERRGHEIVALAGRAALDITDLASVRTCLTAHRPDFVLNGAAWTHVDGAESEPDAAWRLNSQGPANLARVCAEIKSGLVQVSTDFVFDGEKGAPYHEFDTVNPLCVYGASKEAGECLVRQILPERHIIARTAYLFGPKGKNLIDTIVHAAQTRPSLTFVEDQCISPTHTADLARVLLALVEDPLPGTYHVAGAGACSPRELAQEVVAQVGLTTPVLPIAFTDYIALAKPAAQRPRYSALECRQLALLGRDSLPPWQEAVAAYLARR